MRRGVTGLAMSSVTSPSTWASRRRWNGSTTRIMGASAPRRRRPRGDRGRWVASCRRHRGRRRLGRRWCRNRRRTHRAYRSPWLPHRFPRFTAVARTLHDLAEPAARLRSVQPVGINGRSLHVVDFPAAKVRPADVRHLPLANRGQNERPLASPHENANAAHRKPFSLSLSARFLVVRHM